MKEVGTEQVDGVDADALPRPRLRKTARRKARAANAAVPSTCGSARTTAKSGACSSRPAPPARRPEHAHCTMDLSDFGKDVTITVPSAAETADATT